MIRKAEERDIEKIMDLLCQVLEVHHRDRPDLFKGKCTKYTVEELSEILHNPQTPILVATDEKDQVVGYAFCQYIQKKEHNILTDIKSLYIDDLCVDKARRGEKIGKTLYDAVLEMAQENNCYNVTLNVWVCNESALKFYEACGLQQQKIGMEKILQK